MLKRLSDPTRESVGFNNAFKKHEKHYREMSFGFTEVQVDYKIHKPVRTWRYFLGSWEQNPAICDQEFPTCCCSDPDVCAIL